MIPKIVDLFSLLVTGGILTIILISVYIFINFLLLFTPQKTWIYRGAKQLCTTPFFGDAWNKTLQKESFGDMVRRIYDAFPDERYVGLHLVTKPTLMIKDPDLIRQLFIKDFQYFTDHRSYTDAKCDPLWNKNLFALKGFSWHVMRATISPAFTGTKMRGMFDLVDVCAKQLTNHFLEKNNQAIEVEMKDIFTRYATDVIATCAFGVNDLDSFKHPENEFYLLGQQAANFKGPAFNLKLLVRNFSSTLSKVLGLQVFSKDVSNFFHKLVDESISIREKNGIVRPDLINLLMEARQGKLKVDNTAAVDNAGFATVEESPIGMSEKVCTRDISNFDIAAQALLFFFAGFETVSSAMSFFAYELAVNPDIQERLIKEVDETRNNCGGGITYESLIGMKYLDMTLSEVLRKWPPAIVVDRVCVRPYTILPVNEGERPIEIEVGDLLWLPTMGIHYDPKNYENPHTFDPERFSPENKHNINRITYMPFGVGPRSCVASRFAIMEIKIVMFNILSNFKFVVSEKTTIPLVLDKTSFHISSEGGFRMSLERRH